MKTLSISEQVADAFRKAIEHEIYAAAVYNHLAAVQSARGYKKLAEINAKEAAEEQGHHRKIVYWLTVCGERSAIGDIDVISTAETVPDQFLKILRIEEGAINLYSNIMDAAEADSDYNSYNLALEMLNDSREHYEWAMQQLSLIEEIGLPTYLSLQV